MLPGGGFVEDWVFGFSLSAHLAADGFFGYDFDALLLAVFCDAVLFEVFAGSCRCCCSCAAAPGGCLQSWVPGGDLVLGVY